MYLKYRPGDTKYNLLHFKTHQGLRCGPDSLLIATERQDLLIANNKTNRLTFLPLPHS